MIRLILVLTYFRFLVVVFGVVILLVKMLVRSMLLILKLLLNGGKTRRGLGRCLRLTLSMVAHLRFRGSRWVSSGFLLLLINFLMIRVRSRDRRRLRKILVLSMIPLITRNWTSFRLWRTVVRWRRIFPILMRLLFPVVVCLRTWLRRRGRRMSTLKLSPRGRLSGPRTLVSGLMIRWNRGKR